MKQYVMIEIDDKEITLSSNIDSLPVLNESVTMLSDYMMDLYHAVAMDEMDKAIAAVKCATTNRTAAYSNQYH